MKKKVKQHLAGFLAAVTVFSTVFPSVAYAQEPAVEASESASFHILTPDMEWHAEETERRVLYEESQTGDSGSPATVSEGNAEGPATASGGDAEGPATVSEGNAEGPATVSGGDDGGFRSAATVSGGDLWHDQSQAVFPEGEVQEPHSAAAVTGEDASGAETAGTGYILSLTQNSDISTLSNAGTVNVVRDITYPPELGGSYHTHYFTLNGVAAYCLEPNKSSPSDGDGGDVSMMYHPDVTKALYYGYGADVSELTAFLEDRGLEADADRMYVYTHIAVSYYYNGGNASIAFYGIPNYSATPAYEWVNHIKTLADPIYSDGTASYVYPNPVYMKPCFLENVDYWTSDTPHTGAMEHYDRDWAWLSSDAVHITGSAYLAHNTTLVYNTFNVRPWHTGAYSSDDTVSKENGFSGGAAYQVLRARKSGTDMPWYGGNVLVVEGGIVNKSYALRYCTFEGNVQDIGQVAQIELSSSSSSNTLTANITPLQLQFSKTDSRSGSPLGGAVYTLYYDAGCEHEILSAGTDAMGNGIFAFDKTAEIELLNTARDNNFIIYLKETTAPQGYLLDDTVRPIDLSALEYSIKVLNGGYWGCADLGVFSDEQRLVKLTIDIVKRGEALIGADVSEAGVTFRYGMVELPLTAVFHVYAEETIEDGSGNVVYEKGSLVAVVPTDETGHARLMELPLGSYRIVEAAAPEGYELDSIPRYVEVSYDDISADEGSAGIAIRVVSFEDRRKQTSVRVRKFGEQGEKEIGGAVIRLYAAEDIRDVYGNVVVRQDQLIETVTTVSDSTAVFHADLPVTAVYYLREVQAPTGYVRSDARYEVNPRMGDQSVIEILIRNKSQRASLTIYKEGEALTGWNGRQFVYEQKRLPGFAFQVTAGQDIYRADGSLAYRKGDVVADRLVTGEDGSVSLTESLVTLGNPVPRMEQLHLGTYVIREIGTRDGYTLQPKSVTVRIEYAGQEAECAFASETIRNVRQRAEVSVIKLDSDTQIPLQDSEFTLYADTDIRNVYGKVIVSSGTALGTMVTGTDGRAVSAVDLPAGYSYHVAETRAPEGYVLDEDNIYAFKFTDLGDTVEKTTFSHTFYNASQRASLTIYKEGEVLTGWNGRQFVYEQKRLPGFAFQVTAGQDIYRADGSLAYRKGDVVADRLVTGEDGSVSLTESLVTLGNSAPRMEQLHLGTYVIREIGTRDGYTLQQESVTVRIEYAGQEAECSFASGTIRNVRQRAEVSVIKLDSGTEMPLQGGEFTLYADTDIRNVYGEVIITAGTALGTMVTGADGRAVSAVDLPMGYSYHVAETRAPEGYLLDESNTFAFKFVDLEDTVEKTTFSRTFYNDRVTARIQLQKLDLETGEAVHQGDGTLAGAVYGIYAAEDIRHPDGHTGLLYPMGAMVTELTTDAQGFARAENLYLGRYYVSEITPSEGYLLDADENGAPRRYEADCTYEGDRTAIVMRAVTSMEQVMKQPFQLIKLAVTEGLAENQLLEGAGFSAYLLSSLKKLSDGSYDFDSAEPVALCEGGSTILYTDENGYALSIPLPYGTYLVREVVVPENLKAVTPFIVTIDRHMPDTPQQWRVLLDERFTAKLQIIKKDAVTGRNILRAGAGFRIYDLDAEEYVSQYVTYPSREILSTFYTDETGGLILPNALPAGRYRIEEVSAPFGYTINPEHVTITLASDAVYRQDPDTGELVVTVTCEDNPVTGELSVFKLGQVLEDFVYTAGTAETGENAEFCYVEDGIPGVVFEVCAAEDIYTPDGQMSEDGSRCRIYASGETVGTIVTGEDGTGMLTGLPLGTYRIVETEAPEGFVPDGEAQYVTLTYEGDQIPLVFESCSFWNERQRAELNLMKEDGETEEALEGAVYGLYAAEEIRNVRGELLVENGGYIVSAVSDESGEIRFACELPLGSYEVRELVAPAGYVSDGTVYMYDLRAQEGVTVSRSQVFQNYPTQVEITKSDLTTGVELSGAKLTVTDSEGQIIDSWTSVSGKAHVIKGLHVGETYTLTEVLAPYGYLQAESICFVIEDTAEVQRVQMQDTVPVGRLIINKKGEILEKISLAERISGWIRHLFSYGMDGLSGVTFRVYAVEDIKAADQTSGNYYSAGELVATITTDETGIAVLDNLPLGIYCVREAGTAAGYQIDEDERIIDLTYRDQNTPVVTYSEDWNNLRTRVMVRITKLDAETRKALEGAEFGLYCAEDIWSKSGELLFAADELIESGMTDADGEYIFTADLPYGYEYYVKELKAPEGYHIDMTPRFFTFPEEEVLDIEFIFEDQPIEEIPVRLTVRITKLDAETKKKLEGAEFGLYCAEDIWSKRGELLFAADELIESGVTDADGECVFTVDLPYGCEYYVKELKAPEGYYIDMTPRFFTLPEEEVLDIEFVFEDQPMEEMLTRLTVHITKLDAKTREALEGAEFGLYSAEAIWSKRGELLFAADELIESGVTDADGEYVFTVDLPYGYEYYVKELEAPEGYYVDMMPRSFTLPEKEVLEMEFVFEDLPIEKITPTQSAKKNTPDKPTETIREPEVPLTEEELLTEEIPDWNNPRTDDSGAHGYSILLHLENDRGGTQAGVFPAVICSLSTIMLAGAVLGASRRRASKEKQEK